MSSTGICRVYLVVASLIVVNDITVASSVDLPDSPVWDQPSIEVKEGSDLSISCKVFGLGNIDVVRIFHKTSKQTTTVTDNDNVKFPFRNLPQYKIHYELDGNVGIIRLHYRGIKASDSGTLGCHKLSDVTNIAYVDITVLVPVEKFYIFYFVANGEEKRITNDDVSEIVTDDGSSVTVGCFATINSDMIDPQLDIIIDTESRTGEATLIKNVTSVTSENELVSYTSQFAMSLVLKNVSHFHNRKSVDCISKVKGYEDSTKSAILKVRYRPVISCSEKNYKSQYGKSATFVCSICSNPNAQIKWLKENQEDIINATLKEKVLDEECIQANLTISELKTSDFTNYVLRADNEVGRAVEVITVEEDLGSQDEEVLQATEEIFVDKQGELELSVQEDFEETSDENRKSSDDVVAQEAIFGSDQSYSAVSSSSSSMQPVYVLFTVGLFMITHWH